MTNLKRLGGAVTLLCVLSMTTLAGETNSPPCAPPVPGEMPTGPCATAQMTPDDGVAPGELSTPPAANAGSGYSVTEIALGALEGLLSIL